MKFSSHLHIHPEVAAALRDGDPVVALESTIISHGMPYPQNVATAKEVEHIVRENGAVPATIAIIKGICTVGLSSEELEYFGQAKEVHKVSLRDMPYVISQGLYGATTVAATMRIAAMAGISTFVTGGIGGVHRGAEKNMDISADLTEMQHTNVAVISAGVKSILDIGLTLEYLETLSIPVVTVGQEAFPSFYSQDSGYKSHLQLNTPAAIASMLKVKWSMGLNGSVLIANPIPADQEIPAAVMEEHIVLALDAASRAGVRGKDITPYLLSYIAKHTNGESLDANIALIKNNAAIGAKIALAYAALID